MAMKKIFALSFLFVFLTSISFAGTVNLPRTGQTKCYDSAGSEITCVDSKIHLTPYIHIELTPP
jgi:energy-coupling factor transporter transmembrane protein EcfT